MQNLSQLTELFTQYIARNRFLGQPQNLYEPIDYIMSIGGKRIRPVLLLAGYSLFENEVEKALPAAYGFEIFHNFTLVHDDVMDAAPLRRGQMTIHEKYNLSTAILSGDVMMIYAYKYIMESPQESVMEVLKVFTQLSIEVCEGQQMDMDFESRDDVTIREYLEMIRLKTSVLLAGALKAGAVLAKASGEDTENLYRFGENLGMAFQLQDDILDVYGDPKTFGKKVGGDIIQNKKTFLLLKAFEVANAGDRKKLQALLDKNWAHEEDKVEAVRKLYDRLCIKDLAKKEQQKYFDNALRYLGKIGKPEEEKQFFADLLSLSVVRDS